MDFDSVYEKIGQLRNNIEKVIVGKQGVVDLAITCLLAEGHLLIEDVPGVGKSMLAKEDEIRMLRDRKLAVPVDGIAPVTRVEDICHMQDMVRQVKVDDSLYEYTVTIVAATRTSDRLALGASPRTTLRLFRAAQATAVVAGRSYMIPDDVKTVAAAVLAHRVIIKAPVQYKGQPSDSVLTDILNSVAVPY